MDQTGSQVFVVPVKELHQFKLSWLLRWQVAKWKSKPTAYVKYLLEQEGDGSLLAALAAAGLSQNHAVNCFDYHGVASTLELSVDLVNTTEETLMRGYFGLRLHFIDPVKRSAARALGRNQGTA